LTRVASASAATSVFLILIVAYTLLLLFTTAQKGWNQLLTHIIVEAAKAPGGSFKLVTLTPKTLREMTHLPKETQKNGDTNKSKRYK